MLVTRRFSALNGTALFLGAAAGLAAVAFRFMIDIVNGFAFQGELVDVPTDEGGFAAAKWGYWVFLVPLIGGLLVGLVRLAFPEARRQGIAEVMAAMQARGGHIKGRTSWGHAIVSAITVGTGGSTGREGPIGYIGAAFGSSLGRHLGLHPRDIKVLVGAGTAAGIAATFNAPLGGVLFAMELILPEFSTHAFIPVVLATVVAVTMSHAILGDNPAFAIEGFTLVSPWELGIYLLLGVVCGLGGVLFIKLMAWANERGDNLKVPLWSKPAIGGGIVGLLGIGVFAITSWQIFGGFQAYHVFGTGYATVNAILESRDFLLVAPLLALLIFAKPLASSITIGSGGGGGVFSSSLYQGALYGALVGLGANAIFGSSVAPPAAYAIVGMGAFYASSGRATLTTIVLLSELTNGYSIVMPIMFAAVAADAVSIGLSKDSIYTVRLTKRGIMYDHDRVQSPLDFAQVKDVMTREVDSLPGDIDVGQAFNQMIDEGHTGFPVIDADGKLTGVVTRRDLSKALHDGHGDSKLRDVVSGLMITAFPDEMLHRARDRLFDQDIGRLIVVDPVDRTKILGILTRSDMLRAEAERDVEHTDAWGS